MDGANRGKGKCFLWIQEHLDHVGDECLIWPFARNGDGYGTLGYLGKMWKAHRLMCVLVKGEPPTPQHHAAHSCHNGHLGCIHPKHLDWKTPGDNTREYVEQNGGTVTTRRRLTIDQVEAIRASNRSYTDLAAEYGVHKNTIGMIHRGIRWKKPRSALTREQIEKIKELDAMGWRTCEIAKAVGAGWRIVWKTRNYQVYRDR